MSSYFVTGKLGSGKTLVTVGRIFDYLERGRRVATNLDINLLEILSPYSKKTITRVPDKPSAEQMHLLGYANHTPDEELNGLLVLDELGSWFNSRSWNDRTRAPLLQWFIHARKYGWDVMLIVQDIDMVDNQLRAMLGEHLVICKRTDRIRIPLLGRIMNFYGSKGMFPKIHIAKVYYGESSLDLQVDRWIYRGTKFYNAYDTKQIFSTLPEKNLDPYEIPSPWELKGHLLPPKPTLIQIISLLIDKHLNPTRIPGQLKPKHPLIQRIMKLPEHQRLEFTRRFQATGALQLLILALSRIEWFTGSRIARCLFP